MNEEQRQRLEESKVSNAALKKRLAEKALAQEKADLERIESNHARDGYRQQADMLNPNPAVQLYDSRSRPMEKSNNHKWISRHAPGSGAA